VQDRGSAKVYLFYCRVRPVRLRISYGKDVIVFAERHRLHCGEMVLAVVEGTGLACARARPSNVLGLLGTA
jgi:hypothetical protein